MPQVLIVHGWSDTYESFEPLKNLLVAAGDMAGFNKEIEAIALSYTFFDVTAKAPAL